MQTIENFRHLVGKWQGNGIAEYPTIKTFEYTEELSFTTNEKNPVIQFEQKAWIKSSDERNNEPISWESGFIVDKGNNLFELVCTHNSGRLEWYRGFAKKITVEEIVIEFLNVAIVNDDRMINSKRIYVFSKTSVVYEQSMMTTKVSNIQTHLKATLKRY